MEEFSAFSSYSSSSSLGRRSLRKFRQQIRGRLVIRFPFQPQTGEDFLFEKRRVFDRLFQFRRRRRQSRDLRSVVVVVVVKVVPAAGFRSNFRLRNGAKKQTLLFFCEQTERKRDEFCFTRCFTRIYGVVLKSKAKK